MRFRIAMHVVAIGLIVCCTIEAIRLTAFAVSDSDAPERVTIPFLATATKPSALEFEGGQCLLTGDRRAMTCEFQQVIVTTSSFAPDTCLVTTNRYERRFEQRSPSEWVSRDKPTDICGGEVVTLRDEGAVRWTMEIRSMAKADKGTHVCRETDKPAETLSWQNVRRPLPCKYIQPGGINP